MYDIVKCKNDKPIEIIAQSIKSTYNAVTMANALVEKLTFEELQAGFTFKFITEQDEQFTASELQAIAEARTETAIPDDQIDWDKIGIEERERLDAALAETETISHEQLKRELEL